MDIQPPEDSGIYDAIIDSPVKKPDIKDQKLDAHITSLSNLLYDVSGVKYDIIPSDVYNDLLASNDLLKEKLSKLSIYFNSLSCIYYMSRDHINRISNDYRSNSIKIKNHINQLKDIIDSK